MNQNYIELLKKLINQNSYTFNKQGVDNLGKIVVDQLSFMNVKRFSSKDIGDYLIFTSKNSNSTLPKVLLSGHSDTVHKHDSTFPTKITGNKIFGPGAQDMKGSLVVIISLLQKLHAENLLSNITFALTPDEETQSTTYLNYTRELAKSIDYCFVYEPTMQMPSVKKFSKNKRSIVVARKGQGRYKIAIIGKGGHSGVLSNKNDRTSAILEAANKIIDIENAADYKKGTTLNIGLIEGGSFFNVLAENAYLEGDYRVVSLSEHNRLQNTLPKIVKRSYVKGTKSEFEFIALIPPMVPTSKTKSLTKHIKKIGRKIGVSVLEEYRGGGSDGNHISSFGGTVVDGMGPQGNGEHSRNEFVYIESIQPSIDFSYEIIKSFYFKNSL